MSKKEKQIRTFTKTISWRIIATLATVTISYLLTKDFLIAFSIGSIEVFFKMILYYGHERFWNSIDWGVAKEE